MKRLLLLICGIVNAVVAATLASMGTVSVGDQVVGGPLGWILGFGLCFLIGAIVLFLVWLLLMALCLGFRESA